MSLENAPTGLTTAAKVKAYAVGNKGKETGFHDELIKDLIAQVTDEIEIGLGTKLIAAEYEDEELDGGFTEYLQLKHRPVIAFDTLKLNDVEVTASTFQVNKPVALVVQVTDGAATAWTSGTRNYKATYSAGYLTIPGGIERVATRVVARALFMATKDRVGASSKTLDSGGSVDFDPDTISDDEWRTLRHYGVFT